MITNITTRNNCLDCLKGIACIFVVFMHCEFPGYLGVFVQSISRFSVPFFFMVSGYFCYGKTDYLKKIKHIGVIILGAMIFYLVVTPINKTIFSIKLRRLMSWLIFNVPPFATHLWFLFALLYDYLLFALFERWKLRKFAYFLIPVGIITYIFMAQGAHLLGIFVKNRSYRNFLIEGFPLFTLGFWIHEHQDDIQISDRSLFWIVVITTLLCPVERLLMGRDFGVNIVSFLQVIALFLFAVKNPSIGAERLLSKLGFKYSMYIYVIHPSIMSLLDETYKVLHFDEYTFALYILPVLCVALTVLCSSLLYNINKRFQKRAPGGYPL